MQSCRMAGPPALWMAPSTPPPPRSARLAALTIASTRCWVMSPWTTVIFGNAGSFGATGGVRSSPAFRRFTKGMDRPQACPAPFRIGEEGSHYSARLEPAALRLACVRKQDLQAPGTSATSWGVRGHASNISNGIGGWVEGHELQRLKALADDISSWSALAQAITDHRQRTAQAADAVVNALRSETLSITIREWNLSQRRQHSVQRNRILATLAGAIVLLEASARSGSLEFPARAHALGRSVGAVPPRSPARREHGMQRTLARTHRNCGHHRGGRPRAARFARVDSSASFPSLAVVLDPWTRDRLYALSPPPPLGEREPRTVAARSGGGFELCREIRDRGRRSQARTTALSLTSHQPCHSSSAFTKASWASL